MERESSLVTRFAASTAVLAIVVILLAIVFFSYASVRFVHDAIRHPLPGYSRALAQQVLASPDPEVWRRIAREHRVAVLVETQGERRAFDRSGDAVDPGRFSTEGQDVLRVEVAGDEGTRVFFFWDTGYLVKSHNLVLASFVLLLAAVFGVSHWFQRRQLRPLRWLRRGVEAVARGDFETRVPVVRQDEIGRVAGAFNRMTRQVEQMVADRERLLADVSHELRSPLARMKVALELLPENDKRTSIRGDVREMESLIAVLLERERLRARTDRPASEPVDLAALAAEVVDAFADQGPGVRLSAPDPVVVAADPSLLRLLVQNLVDNAVKFSPPDSRPVEVGVRSLETTVELVVADDGPGIAEDDRERVFEPFVKLDPARGHGSGYGLGLNLCRRIVEAHGGTIVMEANPPRGNRAVVVLPATRT